LNFNEVWILNFWRVGICPTTTFIDRMKNTQHIFRIFIQAMLNIRTNLKYSKIREATAADSNDL
jgi:hypothetical protein